MGVTALHEATCVMLSPTVAALLFLAMHAATDCFPRCETSLVCITFVHVDDYSPSFKYSPDSRACT